MANPTGDSLTFDLKLEDVQPGESVRQYFWNLSQDSMVVNHFEAKVLRR